jgi:hypothetical protein
MSSQPGQVKPAKAVALVLRPSGETLSLWFHYISVSSSVQQTQPVHTTLRHVNCVTSTSTITVFASAQMSAPTYTFPDTFDMIKLAPITENTIM